MLRPDFKPVLKLPISFDVDSLIKTFEHLSIFEKFGEDCTVSLMHRKDSADPWSDGLTSSVLSKEKPLYFSEADFKHLNPGLSGTAFNLFYERIDQEFQGRLGRIRLFKRDPQTSSSLHRDLDVRFHLALKTNPSAFLVFPEFGIYHIPADGHLYLVDTTQPHFAVNASKQDSRMHIVCSTYCGVYEHWENEKQIVDEHRSFFQKMAQKNFGDGVSKT